MKVEDIKWCPQHGYPLPCHKCGMPLSSVLQKEIYEKGKKAGIKEVVEWFKDNPVVCCNDREAKEFMDKWQSKLKEWGIE